MSTLRKILYPALFLVFVLLTQSIFVVKETERAVKLRFGEIVEYDVEPGLHFKVPVVNTVRKFDARILTLDAAPQSYLTSEKKALTVDSFVKWRIINTVDFYISTGGSFRVANDRISEIIKNAIVTEFGKRTVQEAISVERAELMRDMLANATSTAEGLGVELVDVRVKQVEFPDDVRNSVYQQMREERGRIAAERRAQGMEVSEEKKSTADKERTIILANANKDSEIIRGEGDAKAAEIYANAYNQDPEFYAFYRSIDAYRNSIGNSNDINKHIILYHTFK